MRHLKTYEGEILDNLDKKSAEYESYAGKAIIFDYKGNLFLGKFLKIILNGYFAKLEHYEWDEHYNGWDVNTVESVHLSDFTILRTFDTMVEAKEEYKNDAGCK